MMRKIAYILTCIFIIVSIETQALTAKPATCTYIEQVEIMDNGMINEFMLHQLQEQYSKRCLSRDDIRSLLSDVADLCIKNGYIMTRVYADPKKLDDNILKVHAVSGVVGNSGFIPRGTDLNIRDVEQESEQISRLKGYSAQAVITPSNNAGESDVIMRITPGEFLGGSASIDNHGTKSNGINQGDVFLQTYNALGAYDILTFDYKYGFNSSFERMASESAMGGIIIPYGYWTFKLHVSYFDYQRLLPGQYTDLQYTGNTYNYTGDIERVVRRDHKSKTIVAWSFILKDSKNFMSKTLLTSSSRKLSILGFKVSHTMKAYDGALSASLGAQQGIRFLGAEKDIPGSFGPKAQFTKYLLDALYAKYLSIAEQHIIWDSSLHIQASPNTLYDSEQIGIGGISSVRGFREAQFQGETGWYVMNNIAYTLPHIGVENSIGNIQVYLGADYGAIKKNKFNSLNQKNISGFALGARTVGKPLTLELAYEKPLHKPYNIRTNDLLYFKVCFYF